MNFQYLTINELRRFFEETDLSFGQILRTITSERFTGIKIENRSRFEEISDEEWLEIMEKALDYEKE